MFSGIVTDVGRIRSVETRGDIRMAIATAYDTAEIEIGASICCSGVCLTVVETGGDWFAVDASAETLACTTAGGWRPGMPVNLERGLRVGDEIGGHFVLGHVDAVSELRAAGDEGDSRRLEFSIPAGLDRLIAPKGSVALDGVSLTVNEVTGDRFGVNIVPHTRQATTLGDARPGRLVNLEVDMIARYLARQMERGMTVVETEALSTIEEVLEDGPARPHDRSRRCRGSRERRRSRDSRGSSDPRGHQLHGPLRTRSHLPGADGATRGGIGAAADAARESLASPDRVHGLDRSARRRVHGYLGRRPRPHHRGCDRSGQGTGRYRHAGPRLPAGRPRRGCPGPGRTYRGGGRSRSPRRVQPVGRDLRDHER